MRIKLSLRAWLSTLTLILLVILLFVSRHEIARAWELLGRVNIWILLLTVPISALSYMASGEMVFQYLRQKKLIKDISATVLMRISLELNFVNHVLPSGGVSGISYMNWRLSKFGVLAGKATMAQMIRYVVGFAALVTLLAVAVIAVTIDGDITRWMILMSSSLVFFLTTITLLGVYLLKSSSRMHSAAEWVTRTTNALVRKISFCKKQKVLDDEVVDKFFADIHDDYSEIKNDRRVLLKPYLWGIFFTLMDVAVFVIVFWALGTPINPAPILIGYGIASFAGYLAATPGGMGAYEAIMVIVLAMAGIAQDQAIAGVVLTRIIILMLTICFGYIFYQHAVMKYGKRNQEVGTDTKV